MRKLLVLILVLLFSTDVFAVTEDQEEIIMADSSTGDWTMFPVTPPTAGCTMVVAGVFAGNGTDMAFSATPVFDTDGNTYVITQSSLAGRQIALIAVADNISVTPTYGITISPVTGAFTYYGLAVFKSFCGLANPASDQTATAADPGPQGSDATVTTAATTQANETVVAAMGVCTYPDASSSNLTITTPSGYTSIISEQDCSLYQAGNISWKNVTATGTQSASWSHADVTGSGVYEGWVAAIVTLKDAIAGGAVARRRSAVVVQ